MSVLPFPKRTTDLTMAATVTRGLNQVGSPDVELWRMRGPKGAIVSAAVREIRSGTQRWDDLIGFELRIFHAGEVYLTKLYKHPDGRDRRAGELKAMLEAKGWIPAEP